MSAAFTLAFVLPVPFAAAVLSVAAVVFTPVLVHDLWHLERRGWLGTFGGVVGTPLVAAVLLPGAPGAASAMCGLFALLAFYTYTWVLSMAVASWLTEAQEELRFRWQEARREADEAFELLPRA